jgi:hypothetical protein
MTNAPKQLFACLQVLPTDYDAYGGKVNRWADPAVDYTELPLSGRNPTQTVNFWASHALARVHAPLP